jgi:PBSX family phage terminase large subunit
MTTSELVVTYQPRGAALKLFKSKDSEILLDGPAGTGKSVAGLFRLHLACLKHKKIRCLLIRKTGVSLAATTLRTYEENVAEHALSMGIVRFFGGNARRPPAYQYRGGSEIVIGGLDKPEKVLSSEYDIIFVDEATELTETDWETLHSRLRHGKLPWQQQIAACNPSFPHHWLNKRPSVTRLISRHSDNPKYVNEDGTFTPEGRDYMDKLDKLTGVRKLRLRDGKWVAAEGLVYEDFDPAVHVIDPFPIPDEWTRYWVIDWGFTNPFVCQFWAQDPDGRLYLYREIYRTRRTVDQHCEQIAQLVMENPVKDEDEAWRGTWKEPQPYSILCDHDAEDRQTFENELDLSTDAADKKVDAGIQTAQARFRLADDGKPRVYFMRGCVVSIDTDLRESGKPTSTIEEVPGYVWDIKPGGELQERPRKVDDHGMDGFRYLCKELDQGSQPRYRSFRY